MEGKGKERREGEVWEGRARKEGKEKGTREGQGWGK